MPNTPVTTVENLRKIIETEARDEVLDACITTSNVLINQHLRSKGITACGLAEIERWLAAHFVQSTNLERISKEEGAGGAFIKYAGNFDLEGLKSTRYGQMAMLLDPSGTLESLTNKKMVISMYAIPR